MPFYDLYCKTCDKEYNIMATMANKVARLIPCPDCGSTELETVYARAPAFIKNTPEPICANSRTCGAACKYAG